MLAVIHIVLMNVVFAEYQLLQGLQNIPLTSGGRCHQLSEKGLPRPKRRSLKQKRRRRKAMRKSRRVKSEQREKKKRRKRKKQRKPNPPRKTTKTIMFPEWPCPKTMSEEAKFFNMEKGLILPSGEGPLPLLHAIQIYQTLMYLMMMTS